jgi:hypothetical protein
LIAYKEKKRIYPIYLMLIADALLRKISEKSDEYHNLWITKQSLVVHCLCPLCLPLAEAWMSSRLRLPLWSAHTPPHGSA